MDRRGFLKSILALGVAPAVVRAGSLMPVVQTATGLLIPAAAVILWGDGVHNDQPGLQALLKGERVVLPDGSEVSNHQGTIRLDGGKYLVDSMISGNAGGRQIIITGAQFIGGASLGNRPLLHFHNNAPGRYTSLSIENSSFIDRNDRYSVPAKKISKLLASMLLRSTL